MATSTAAKTIKEVNPKLSSTRSSPTIEFAKIKEEKKREFGLVAHSGVNARSQNVRLAEWQPSSQHVGHSDNQPKQLCIEV